MIKAPQPCLWFNDNAEEAVKLYCSLIPISEITGRTYFAEGSFKPVGELMTITFNLNGLPHMGINGGDMFKHSPALSLVLECDTQAEIDHLWNGFINNGGTESQCGWLTDKFGISWQIIPRALIDIYTTGGERAARTAKVMYGMQRLILKDLIEA